MLDLGIQGIVFYRGQVVDACLKPSIISSFAVSRKGFRFKRIQGTFVFYQGQVVNACLNPSIISSFAVSRKGFKFDAECCISSGMPRGMRA
jgi:nitrate reductase beta subunit